MSVSNKDLQELMHNGIIDEGIAQRIRQFYTHQTPSSGNRLLVAFGILGSALAGLGIILLVAHNWDQLSKNVKSLFAFLPLILSLVLSGFVLLKKSNQDAWREASAILLILSIGACLALISQIYHIPGKLSSFLFTWLLMSVGFIYLMRSLAASLLYIALSTMYATDLDNELGNTELPLGYLVFAALITPFIYYLFKTRPKSNFSLFHHWFIAVSVTITLGFFNTGMEELGILQYLSLFTCMLIIGQIYWFNDKSVWHNAYRIIGAAGTLSLLVFLSFEFFWTFWAERDGIHSTNNPLPAKVFTIILVVIPFLLQAVIQIKKSGRWQPNESIAFPILLLPIFAFPTVPHIGQILTNVTLIVLALIIAYRGVKTDHLGKLNYGLLIILLVATCRFFDDNISFILRGTLFIAAGAGLILSNYIMVKRRNNA